MGEPAEGVRLPGNAIDPTGADIIAPAVAILDRLYLLPSKDELDKAGSIGALFTGPPQSVAVIEGGATALSKWWAAGLGVTVAAGWGSLATFWDSQGSASQRAIVLAMAIATAAIILAIGYIVGSDVRGRAAAAVAIIEARTKVAESVIGTAKGRDAGGTDLTIMTIEPRSVKYLSRPAADEDGWMAIALQSKPDGTERKFLIVKASVDAWAAAAELEF